MLFPSENYLLLFFFSSLSAVIFVNVLLSVEHLGRFAMYAAVACISLIPKRLATALGCRPLRWPSG